MTVRAIRAGITGGFSRIALPMLRSFRLFSDLVKLEHTIFALPFAYIGCLMAADGHASLVSWGWVTLAMVAARTAGMTLNRLIDRNIDARNPRTRDRALPAGRVSVGPARWVALASLALLFYSAWHCNPLALALSPIAVGLLVAYSYLKRFTSYAHFGIGLVLACAPVGGWVAVRGELGAVPLCLGAGVLAWVAGFDVLYACLDVDFDRTEGLHSIPARRGTAYAFRLARLLHVGSILAIAVAGHLLGLGPVYFVGVGVAGALLVYEHSLVTPHDLSRMDQAFFTMNGWVSVTLLVFTWLSYRMAGTGALLSWIFS